MTLSGDLFTYLSSVSAITAIVQDRIYSLVRRQEDPLPCIVIQQISGPRLHSHDGVSGLANPRFQFSCWTKKDAGPAACETLSEALRTALDCYTSGDIQATFLVSEWDDIDEETGDYRKGQDYIFWYGE